jgi:hypothetical protein
MADTISLIVWGDFTNKKPPSLKLMILDEGLLRTYSQNLIPHLQRLGTGKSKNA